MPDDKITPEQEAFLTEYGEKVATKILADNDKRWTDEIKAVREAGETNTDAAMKAIEEVKAVASELKEEFNELVSRQVSPNTSDASVQSEMERDHAKAFAKVIGSRGDRDAVQAYADVHAKLTDVYAASGDVIYHDDPNKGAYFLPRTLSTNILTLADLSGGLRLAADRMTSEGVELEIPVEVTRAEAGWSKLRTADEMPNTGQSELNSRVLRMHEVYTRVPYDNAWADFSAAFVQSHFEQTASGAMARVENKAFIEGSGVNEPRGLMTTERATAGTKPTYEQAHVVKTGLATGFPNPADNAPSWKPLLTARAQLLPGDRVGGSWIANRENEVELFSLTDADGRPLVRPNLEADPAGITLLGHPLYIDDFLPDTTQASGKIACVFLGRRAYTIVDKAGMRFFVNPYQQTRRVIWETSRYIGGDVTHPNAIVFVEYRA